MKKSKSDIINGWIEKAERDLEVAKREISLPKPFTDIICFHAQQSVEKIMKAYLIYLDIEFQKTHDIEDLVVGSRTGAPLNYFSTFPAPATSNPAFGFPELGFLANFS